MPRKTIVESGSAIKKHLAINEQSLSKKDISNIDKGNIDISKLYKPVNDTDRKIKFNYIMKQCLSFVSQLPPINIRDVSTLYNRFYLIAEYIYNNDFVLGNKNIYFMMDILEDDIYNMEHGLNGYGEEHRLFVKKLKQFCSNNREGMLLNGDINPVVGIFQQKVYDGMIEPKVVQVEHKIDNTNYTREELNKEFDLLLDNIENTKL